MSILSESEKCIMDIAWERGNIQSAELVQLFSSKKKWKIQTVATFLTRLCSKGFLSVEKKSGVNIYTPTIDKKQYESMVSEIFLKNNFSGNLKSFIASLYESKGISNAELQELKKWFEDRSEI